MPDSINISFLLQHSDDGKLRIYIVGDSTDGGKYVRRIYVSNAQGMHSITFECTDGSEYSLAYTPQ